MSSEKHQLQLDTVNYELDKVEHELVSKYQPKFLTKGGEHIVYEIAGHPDVVVKVSTGPLKRIIDWNIEHHLPTDLLPKEIELLACEYLAKERARYQKVKGYFGSEHVPSQKEFILKIPITEGILNALYEGKSPAEVSEVWGVVMVQKRVEALADPKHLAIVGGYSEHGEVPEDVYAIATEHLVFAKNPQEKIEKDLFLKIQSPNELKALLEMAERDTNLKAVLKELIEKIISYTEDTGEIFDLVGQDNIVLSQKNGEWDYVLVDTRYPGESKMVDEAKVVLLKLSSGSEIDGHEKNILLNIFNFVRTVNGLAEQVGAQNRLNIVPEAMGSGRINFFKVLND
jgi:hypothetical protein